MIIKTKITIDLTSVKQHHDINKLEKAVEIYELEIDVNIKTKTKDNYLELILNEINTIKKYYNKVKLLFQIVKKIKFNKL